MQKNLEYFSYFCADCVYCDKFPKLTSMQRQILSLPRILKKEGLSGFKLTTKEAYPLVLKYLCHSPEFEEEARLWKDALMRLQDLARERIRCRRYASMGGWTISPVEPACSLLHLRKGIKR